MRILLTGDYFYDSPNYESDFELIKERFSEYDRVVMNYEGSIPSDRPIRKAVNLGMSEKSLDLPDNVIVSLANNHVFDYDEQGVHNTINGIKSGSLRYFGLESRKGSYDNFTIAEQGGKRVCLAGFGWKNEECRLSTETAPGILDFNKRNIDNFFLAIRCLQYDYLIVYVHAGYEYEYYPLPLHVGLYRYLISKGADLVYSSHTHVVQPYEVCRNTYIFYGLGNFYFGSMRDRYPTSSDYGIVLSVNTRADKNTLDVDVMDVLYDRNSGQTTILNSSDYLANHVLDCGSLNAYSSTYKSIRTRKKNPRPILHYDRETVNTMKYLAWLTIVKIAGLLKIRLLVKRLLGWA